MIKRLRIKFVCIVMAVAALMVGLILSVVIYFTGTNMRAQSIHMMHSIAARPFQQGSLGNPLDDQVRLPFFVVQVGSRGTLIGATSGYFDLSDREYLQQIVNEALSTDQETGKLAQHNLRYLKSASYMGFSIVFADTTAETTTVRNMIYLCTAIFLVAMGVFLCVSILLSQWAIRPVENAWEQQKQFVADASHELKTPLSVILANAELLHAEDAGEEERKTFSKNILTMSYQMRALVENLLEMARVDNGLGNTAFSSVQLSQLVEDAVLSFQLLFEEKGRQVETAIADGVCLQGSERHLFQVLDVLLDNAVKYAQGEGAVQVSLRQNGRSCLLTVSSPGEALSREELEDIFKRFYRVDKARSRNGSYGLGLSIARSVVTAHKGKIWAQSENGRNTFLVQLPAENPSGRKE